MKKQNIKNLSWRVLTTVILTLTAVLTVWVYAAFVEPTAGPNDSDQDFAQNILGANNADNDFDSSLVTANNDGSVVERLTYLVENLYTDECGESTISTQVQCYVDDTARYLTTDLCNETKENQCFVPTDNSYYAFGSECSDSTTTTTTNCYIDDTAKYVDSNACSASANTGYCYVNTSTFTALDSDLVASSIKDGVIIFGVTGTIAFKAVFVTAATYTGDLGGLSGADAKCQSQATTYGIPGTFKAWISDHGTTVASRFYHSSLPYKYWNGSSWIQIADNWSDLTDGTLDNSIDTTVTGGATTGNMYTGTGTDGGFGWGGAYTCYDWGYGGATPDGYGGVFGRTDAWWTAYSTGYVCSNSFNIMCFEQ